MKKQVIAIPSFFVITTIVYASLYPIFLEMDSNALGEGINFVVDEVDKTMTYSPQQQQQVETECKSPCPKSAELCAFMCA
jgi:hypothetical protein